MNTRPSFRSLGWWTSALLLAALLLATASVGEPVDKPSEAKPVKAQRYRLFIVESGLEWSHGGGSWCEEIYLPGSGLVCNVMFKTDVKEMIEGGKDWIRPVASAFKGVIRNRFRQRPGDDEDTVSKVEPVEIPAVLAREIEALADLTRRRQEASRRLGKRLVDLGICRVTDPYTRKLLDLQNKPAK